MILSVIIAQLLLRVTYVVLAVTNYSIAPLIFLSCLFITLLKTFLVAVGLVILRKHVMVGRSLWP